MCVHIHDVHIHINGDDALSGKNPAPVHKLPHMPIDNKINNIAEHMYDECVHMNLHCSSLLYLNILYTCVAVLI